MSVQAVRDFWQKVKGDPGLEKKLKGIHEKEGEATLAALLRLGQEAGFVFAAEDYTTFVKEELANQHSAGALDEQELATIAGGGKEVSAKIGIGSCVPAKNCSP